MLACDDYVVKLCGGNMLESDRTLNTLRYSASDAILGTVSRDVKLLDTVDRGSRRRHMLVQNKVSIAAPSMVLFNINIEN